LAATDFITSPLKEQAVGQMHVTGSLIASLAMIETAAYGDDDKLHENTEEAAMFIRAFNAWRFHKPWRKDTQEKP
jgi:hypothetical protein